VVKSYNQNGTRDFTILIKEARMRQAIRRLTMVSSMVVGGVLIFAVDQAVSMSLFHHDNHGGGPQQSVTGKANGGSQGTSSANGNSTFNASPVTVTPEPSTIALMASGLIGIGLWRLRKKS